MSDRAKIIPASREVIAQRLLGALEQDSSVVACLFDAMDMDVVIEALQKLEGEHARTCYARQMANDLTKLRDGAFPGS